MKTRREFLRQGALGMAGLAAGLGRLSTLTASAQTPANDYRALVCIFLFGGNDGNNMVVPLDSEFTAYQTIRGGTGGIALAQSSFVPIYVPSANRQFGLHPALADVAPLFGQQRLAVLCNVGTLVQPLTRAQYLASSGAKPANLFSHSDQQDQWHSAVSDAVSQT